MGSPVMPSDLPALSATASVCARLSQLLTLWDKFREFLDWLVDDNGDLSNEVLSGIADRTVPIGTILMYGSASPPSDRWLTCVGQAVSRTTYADLFGRIGTTYGTGDGSSTFNLPDLRAKVPIGSGSIYAPGATGGSATATLNLEHFHGIAITSGNDNINFPTRSWSKASNGTGPTIGISGDDVDDADTGAITSGDIGSTTEINSLAAVNVATLPPYVAIPFIIKAL